MPPELYAYRPIAITTRKRHSWKPYSTRHSRTTRSLPIFPFDFTQAPTRKFASQPDINVDELESEMRRMSLTPVSDSILTEERRKFEDEKRRFEAEKRELEIRVRVAEHKAAGRHRRCEELRAEVEDLHQELEEAQDFCLKTVRGLNLQEERIAQKDQTIAKRDSYLASLIEDGRAIIQQKDREIAALKAQAVRPQYPIQSQQYPSQYFSPYALAPKTRNMILPVPNLSPAILTRRTLILNSLFIRSRCLPGKAMVTASHNRMMAMRRPAILRRLLLLRMCPWTGPLRDLPSRLIPLMLGKLRHSPPGHYKELAKLPIAQPSNRYLCSRIGGGGW
ncbi:hypothetical protein BDZ89DRAFT_148525 [Hymenopellis radicata]|nr:hypothetical protein BDZ89DRAFT_148525 [Hymenopellis radicata]